VPALTDATDSACTPTPGGRWAALQSAEAYRHRAASRRIAAWAALATTCPLTVKIHAPVQCLFTFGALCSSGGKPNPPRGALGGKAAGERAHHLEAAMTATATHLEQDNHTRDEGLTMPAAKAAARCGEHGRPSAFPPGLPLVRRDLRLPASVWATLATLAAAQSTTIPGAIARLAHPLSSPTETPGV